MSGKEKQKHKHKSIALNGYVILEELGSGSYGTVYKVQNGTQFFAIKMMKREIIREKKLEKSLSNEIFVMKQIICENCVKIYKYFTTSQEVCLVLEYCNSGNLLNYIWNSKPNEKECLGIFMQLLKGYKAIHEKGFLHRDLKPENILVQKVGKRFIYKIADFGLAKTESTDSQYAGTPHFMAPEVLKQIPHNYKSDLWSIGVILYFMMFRKYPFNNRNNLLKEIQKSTVPKFDVVKQLGSDSFKFKISNEIKDLFELIFVFDYEQRMSFSYLYNLQFLKQFECRELLNQYSKVYKAMETATSKIQFQKDLEDDCRFEKMHQTIHTIINDSPEENEEHSSIIEENKKESSAKTTTTKDVSDTLSTIQQEGPIYKINTFLNPIDEQNEGGKSDDEVYILGPKFQVQEVEDEKQEGTQIQKFDQFSEADKISCIRFRLSNEMSMQEQLDIEQEFQQHFECYNSEIHKYHFISDTISSIKSMKMKFSIQIIINYLLSKLIIFFAQKLKSSLDKAENVFNLPNFEQFLMSGTQQKLSDKIQFDIQKWQTKMLDYYYQIDIAEDIDNDLIRKAITDEVAETDFEKDLKIPIRLAFNIVIKFGYKMALKNQDDKQPNLNNVYLRASLCLLLCMLINQAFEQECILKALLNISQQKGKQKALNYFQFYIWTGKASDQELIKLINLIIEVAFGVSKFSDFMQSIKN